MDGKRPETSGGSQPAGGDRPVNLFPGHNRSSSDSKSSSSRCSQGQQSSPGPQPTLPHLNWDLFQDFSLSSENAAYTLHDGFGHFLDATGESKTIWNRPNGELPKESIFDLVENPTAFKAWFSRLELPRKQEEATIKTIRQNGSSKQIYLKRIPLFVGVHPEQTRIVLKAVVSSDPNSRADSPEINRVLRFACSAQGNLDSANDAFIAMLGLDESEVQSFNIIDSVHPEDADRFSEYLAMQKPREEIAFLQIRFKTGENLERSLLLHPQPSADGHVFRAVDITFPESGVEPMVDQLNNGLPGYSIAVLENSKLVASNLLFEMETGFEPDTFNDTPFSELQGEATDKNAAALLASALDNRTECHREIYLYRKSNDGFWAKAQILPLRDKKGVFRSSALALENITREREAQGIAMQQESLRSLGQMASGIAHDFNNLLAPILGFSELLLKMPEDGRDNEKLVSFLEKIKVAAQDGAAVVNRLREFYGSQDREMEVAVEIDPHSLAQQVKDLTQHRWKSQAEARGVDIAFHANVTTSHCLRGNESEIRQALSNLVLNAADAIESDGSISLTIEDFQDNIRIIISDTGKGMSEEEIVKCQDPFYSTKGKSGTGLGLSIVANIVKRHGGEFRIESEKGVGSTVSIILPAQKTALPETVPSADEKKLRPLRVMLVDDEAVLLAVISELLGNGGHEVDNFESGEEAVKAFASKPYDLVITDRAMPNMSGDALAKRIKAQSPKTPIIMVTGFSDMINASASTPENVDLVLAKPVPLNTLNQRIYELVDQQRN